MKGEHSALLHSLQRLQARAGVSPRSGPVKYKPLSSQTPFPPETHYWSLSATPSGFLLLLRWKWKKNRKAAARSLTSALHCGNLGSPLVWRITPPEITQSSSGCTQLRCCTRSALVPIMNTWIHKHKMGLWISFWWQLLSKLKWSSACISVPLSCWEPLCSSDCPVCHNWTLEDTPTKHEPSGDVSPWAASPLGRHVGETCCRVRIHHLHLGL